MTHPTTTADVTILRRNLDALSEHDAVTAQRLHAAAPPESTRQTRGRDGSVTFHWADESGQDRWLGRTTMPTVSGPTLAEAFNPGEENALLAGFGCGVAARRLLDRMHPHQAVMAVDDRPWAVALALRLHDFSDALLRRRLLLFAADDPWESLKTFLLAHDGFLTPERILAWPWFDASAINDVTARLHRVASVVAEHRVAAQARRPAPRRRPAGSPSAARVAIVSALTDPAVRGLGARIACGARDLGGRCRRFTLDSPERVHPRAIEADLADFDPTLILVVSVAPSALPYRLPDRPTCIVTHHDLPLAVEWLASLPEAVRLALPAARQVRQASAAGIVAPRVMHTPPAAVPGLDAADPPSDDRRLIFLGNLPDSSAEAAGLNLASHRHLWHAASDLLREWCETYRDEQAADLLNAAEKRLGITLVSDEVRAGLVLRIRQRLGPAIVRYAAAQALLDAGLEVSLFGTGWDRDPRLATNHRGVWPDPAAITEVLTGHGAVIVAEPSGCVPAALLDAVTAAHPVIVRAHDLDETEDGLAAVLDPEAHVWRYSSTKDMVGLAQRFVAAPGDFRQRAEAAARHVNEHHTWSRRLRAIQEAFEACPSTAGR
ncbi:MAG: glycosyltransferase [Phycisphaerae bacterium]